MENQHEDQEKRQEEQQMDFKRVTEIKKTTSSVIQGLIWSEILGPPRAIKPYSPLYRTRR